MRETFKACLFLGLMCLNPSTSLSETLQGSSVESRITLAFNVNAEAAQAMLPDGWTLLTLPKGPFAGANLLTVFIDKHLYSDADGNPLTPHASKTVGIVSYGVKKGIQGARLFLTHTYETPPVINPYGNSQQAGILRQAALDDQGNDPRLYRESWQIAPDSGGSMTLNLSYRSARPAWTSATAQPFSAQKLDFYRIYRYQQLGELLMSNNMGKPLKGEVSFQSDIAELADIFDGNQTLVGIMVAPVYQRQIFLP